MKADKAKIEKLLKTARGAAGRYPENAGSGSLLYRCFKSDHGDTGHSHQSEQRDTDRSYEQLHHE